MCVFCFRIIYLCAAQFTGTLIYIQSEKNQKIHWAHWMEASRSSKNVVNGLWTYSSTTEKSWTEISIDKILRFEELPFCAVKMKQLSQIGQKVTKTRKWIICDFTIEINNKCFIRLGKVKLRFYTDIQRNWEWIEIWEKWRQCASVEIVRAASAADDPVAMTTKIQSTSVAIMKLSWSVRTLVISLNLHF